jgi:hypothetical protein
LFPEQRRGRKSLWAHFRPGMNCNLRMGDRGFDLFVLFVRHPGRRMNLNPGRGYPTYLRFWCHATEMQSGVWCWTKKNVVFLQNTKWICSFKCSFKCNIICLIYAKISLNSENNWLEN